MHGRGRCRQRGAENDCGGQRDCCPARHFRISGLSCRGLTPNRLATAALSWLGKTWGSGSMMPSASGWVVQCETHQIRARRRWVSQELYPSYRADQFAKGELSSDQMAKRFGGAGDGNQYHHIVTQGGANARSFSPQRFKTRIISSFCRRCCTRWSVMNIWDPHQIQI
jgi:hypothetical protein